MTPKERIETVLRGELPDKIPLTIYWIMLPRGEQERLLRNKGLGISWRVEVIDWQYPNCRIKKEVIETNGKEYTRTIWDTPMGEIHSTTTPETMYGTGVWTVEYPYKNKDDYKVLKFIADDAVPVPRYENFFKIAHHLGDDGYLVTQHGPNPLVDMILNVFGCERYGLEMIDNADAFWSLYESFSSRMRRAYPLLADSPGKLILYRGNVQPDFVGPEIFEKYIISCHDELAGHLHEKNKLLGVHFDGNTKLFKDIIGSSDIDVIEAFTPPPDCDLSFEYARRDWSDKIVWINFPSSVHLSSEDVIRQTTKNLLFNSGPGNRFIIGITENVPEEHLYRSLNVIADTINEFGITPIEGSH